MKAIFDHLKAAYPNALKDATEIRNSSSVPGLAGQLIEILYDNGQRRSIRWNDRNDLHEALRKLDDELGDNI